MKEQMITLTQNTSNYIAEYYNRDGSTDYHKPWLKTPKVIIFPDIISKGNINIIYLQYTEFRFSKKTQRSSYLYGTTAEDYTMLNGMNIQTFQLLHHYGH